MPEQRVNRALELRMRFHPGQNGGRFVHHLAAFPRRKGIPLPPPYAHHLMQNASSLDGQRHRRQRHGLGYIRKQWNLPPQFDYNCGGIMVAKEG